MMMQQDVYLILFVPEERGHCICLSSNAILKQNEAKPELCEYVHLLLPGRSLLLLKSCWTLA